VHYGCVIEVKRTDREKRDRGKPGIGRVIYRSAMATVFGVVFKKRSGV
jgi:hypothetical protein